MEIIFAAVIAAGIGTLIRYLVPGRDTHGLMLLTTVAAAATLIVWVGLLWLGFTFDGGWIWVISIAAGTIAPLVLALVLPGRRAVADEQLFQRLASPSAP